MGLAFGAVARPPGSEGVGFDARVKERFEARAAQRKASQSADPHGLTEQIFSNPVLDAFSTSNGKARAEFHIEVDSLEGKELGVAYNWQLATDRGVFVAEGRGPSVGLLRAKSVYATEKWQTPEVPNGFYVLLTTTAVSSADSTVSDVAVSTVFLRAEKGSLWEVSEEEWRQQSQAGYAFREGG